MNILKYLKNDHLEPFSLPSNKGDNLHIEHKFRIFDFIRKNIFKYDDYTHFRIVRTELSPSKINLFALSAKEAASLNALIPQASGPSALLDYLFKTITRVHIEMNWVAKLTPAYTSFHGVRVIVRHLDPANPIGFFRENQMIFEADIFLKEKRFVKDCLCWKLIELCFPRYLKQILYLFPKDSLKLYFQRDHIFDFSEKQAPNSTKSRQQRPPKAQAPNPLQRADRPTRPKFQIEGRLFSANMFRTSAPRSAHVQRFGPDQRMLLEKRQDFLGSQSQSNKKRLILEIEQLESKDG